MTICHQVSFKFGGSTPKQGEGIKPFHGLCNAMQLVSATSRKKFARSETDLAPGHPGLYEVNPRHPWRVQRLGTARRWPPCSAERGD
jgi:hypothetical protein